jgi:hypothetical protein
MRRSSSTLGGLLTYILALRESIMAFPRHLLWSQIRVQTTCERQRTHRQSPPPWLGWPILDRPRNDQRSQGGVLLMGDAWHAVRPFMATRTRRRGGSASPSTTAGCMGRPRSTGFPGMMRGACCSRELSNVLVRRNHKPVFSRSPHRTSCPGSCPGASTSSLRPRWSG